MSGLADETVVRRAAEQVSADLADEAVVLDLDRGVYRGLNEVGASLWERLAEPRTVGELRAAIREEYEVDRERCDEDLRAFLETMADHGLVEFDREDP